MRMLVTRPQPDADDTVARLRALGIDATLCPLLEFDTLSTTLPAATGFAAIALTSGNALRALGERGEMAQYTKLRAYTVGDRTADRAREAGLADVVSAGGTFADLVELLAHARLRGPVFYPAGREHSGDLAKSLAPYGVMVITAQVYAMNPVASLPPGVREDLADGTIGAALFYSRRTAEAFVRLADDGLERAARARLGVLCLSEGVAEPLVNAHFVRVGLADHPSEEAMMGLALSFARDQNGA
ncbi:MAG TPA: uroporphyrinogen-III synthase [Devosia sp.]|nr:uroporphyrinogen-III synthase [Devosia sp.]